MTQQTSDSIPDGLPKFCPRCGTKLAFQSDKELACTNCELIVEVQGNVPALNDIKVIRKAIQPEAALMWLSHGYLMATLSEDFDEAESLVSRFLTLAEEMLAEYDIKWEELRKKFQPLFVQHRGEYGLSCESSDILSATVIGD